MRNSSGFSLVELSIVLVILGLLVAGVTTGQSLIKAAELRAITTELESYTTAVNSFRGKYFGLPGDITNATAFWAAATTNGNNDGIIDDAAAAGGAGETFAFWDQLVLSGMIQGSYTGFAGAGHELEHIPGINAPESKYATGGWSTGFWDASAITTTDHFALNYNNFFNIGRILANNHPHASLFRPEEAWNIDKKIDDAIPSTGNVIGVNWSTCIVANTGVASASNLDTSYNLASENVACAIKFRDVF